jgi:class 3 adenylate cyclase
MELMAESKKKRGTPPFSIDENVYKSIADYQSIIDRLKMDDYSHLFSTLPDYSEMFKDVGVSNLALEKLAKMGIGMPHGLSAGAADSLIKQGGALQSELAELRAKVQTTLAELRSKGHALNESEHEVEQLRSELGRIAEIERINHLLRRVNASGQSQLLRDSDFRASFTDAQPKRAFVLSMDVRRSTDLMLKAREPRMYADFLLHLATGLREIVLKNFGVFDKFTGDGVLAFFPEFFAGRDAGLSAVKTAIECHELFARHYTAHRSSFNAIIKGAGLGIGIDYGDVHIVEIGSEVTVVGTPVVYACRLGGASAGTTLVNQFAYEQLFERHPSHCDFAELSLDVKHEGAMIVYGVTGSGKQLLPAAPEWSRAQDHTVKPTE